MAYSPRFPKWSKTDSRERPVVARSRRWRYWAVMEVSPGISYSAVVLQCDRRPRRRFLMITDVETRKSDKWVCVLDEHTVRGRITFVVTRAILVRTYSRGPTTKIPSVPRKSFSRTPGTACLNASSIKPTICVAASSGGSPAERILDMQFRVESIMPTRGRHVI